MSSEEHSLPVDKGTVIRPSSHERVDTDDDDLPEQLEQLREEQGDVGFPEVDVPPENESDDDASAAAKVAEHNANLEKQASLASHTGISNVDALEAVASLDDFEEDERQVQRELEHSENSGELETSIQNRELNEHNLIRHHDEDDHDDYEDDYPDGLILGHPIEYPDEPPPAYASPPKAHSPPFRRVSTPHVSGRNSLTQASPGSATAQLLLGGMTLAGVAKPGIRDAREQPFDHDDEYHSEVESDNEDEHYHNEPLPILQEPDPYGHEQENPSSPESYHFNDAIRDQHSTGVSPRVLPPIPKEAMNEASRRSSTIDDSTAFDSPKSAYPITNDLKNLLSVVQQYQAVNIPIDMYLLPFDVNYIAAVGDVHPGFRVSRPDGQDDQLGLVMIDEPAGKQSSTISINLYLQKENTQSDQPVNKLERADKNTKAIDQWIETVKEVRRSRPPDRVVYTKPMPDIEKLMEEWRPEVDNAIKEAKLPTANLDASVDEFADLCLSIADIPNHGNRIQSLHVLFSLYNEFKTSQHFHNMAYDGEVPVTETNRLEL